MPAYDELREQVPHRLSPEAELSVWLRDWDAPCLCRLGAHVAALDIAVCRHDLSRVPGKVSRMECEWYGKSTVIFGCGNWLCGDDGFGPAVVQRLRRDVPIPPHVSVMDVGTSIREILFDIILSDNRPAKIVVVDAVDAGREPGELCRLDIRNMHARQSADLSLHQMPTINLLQELQDLCGIDVTVIVCQVLDRSDRVKPGLTEPVERAIDRAVGLLQREHLSDG